MRILGDRVLIKPIAEEKMVRGFFLPGQSDNQLKALVVEVGDECLRKISKGDTVVYDRCNFSEFVIEDQVHYIIEARSLLAVS